MNSKIKIAIVEDELIIAETLTKKLETIGYSVLEPVINYTSALFLNF